MKLLPKMLMLALFAGILVQGVYAEDPEYVFLTAWGSYGTGDGEFDYPNGIAVDSAGNVYVADTYNHRIQKFDARGNFLTKWGLEGSGDGQFNDPFGITVDSAGIVYVADTGNHRIQKFDAAGTFITTWGSEGYGDGEFRKPCGVAVDSAGNVYVTDTSNDRIQKFDAGGAFITTWGSCGSGNGQFDHPHGIALDAAGNVYVADTSNDRIQKFDAAGTFITTWGIKGTREGEFWNPFGVAIDPTGNVYVADGWNSRIQKFDAEGAFITTWGSEGSGNGQFSHPYGVAVDSACNVYVADTLYNRVQKFAIHLPPVADAGGDQTLTAGWALTFDGRNSSDPNDNIASYEWWFSEGGAATGPITTRVYEAPGTYYATLTVTDATDFSDSDMIQIIVIPEAIENPMEATRHLIGEIEALDLPRGTERKMVTKLEEVLKYLEHTNARLAAVSADLEDHGSDELVDKVREIMEAISGDGYGLAAISPGNSAASAYEKPLTISPSTGPEPPAPPDDPDQDEETQEKTTDKKEKKDHPVHPDK